MDMPRKSIQSKSAKFWLVMLASLLVVSVVFSSIAVIYASHLSRQQFVSLQRAGQARDGLQVEWGQLLLEQSTWASHGRVEKYAKDHLGMHVPELQEMIVIGQ